MRDFFTLFKTHSGKGLANNIFLFFIYERTIIIVVFLNPSNLIIISGQHFVWKMQVLFSSAIEDDTVQNN